MVISYKIYRSILVVMANLKTRWALLAIATMTLMLMTASVFTGSVLAVKKSSSSSVKAIHKTTTAAQDVKGVKVLSVHTAPSKVAVGNTFGLRAIVFNNSTATISFSNGTCTSPLPITFDKNVITEPKTTTTSCKAQQVTLKPGEQSPISSGITYRATAPGVTNASMIFKYRGGPASSKSPTSDSYSRVYTFNIQPAGSQPTTPHPTTKSTSSSQPGSLRLTP
ncbi:MAG TPA: hypothetical protein VFI73_01485 [Candidatus Nitrosopolaris sp.]|nr:hypothetical protein [Candidatus Nitrosopolaris sp.]